MSITITCTNCRHTYKVMPCRLGTIGADLCDNCLITEQNNKHGYSRADPQDAAFEFQQNEKEAWENRPDE